MRLQGTLWNDEWATQGGRVKTDAGALLRLLPQPPGDAVRAVPRRGVVRRRAAGVGVVRAAAGQGGAQGGAGEAHDLRLLRG